MNGLVDVGAFYLDRAIERHAKRKHRRNACLARAVGRREQPTHGRHATGKWIAAL